EGLPPADREPWLPRQIAVEIVEHRYLVVSGQADAQEAFWRRRHEVLDHAARLRPAGDIVAEHDDDLAAAELQRVAQDLLLQRAQLRSEEHTSELQSPDHLVCRLLLE